MRICLYTNTALPKIGGQELAVDALARQFVQASHEVVVLAPRPRHKWKLGDKKFSYRIVRHPRPLSTRWMVSCYRHWLLHLCQRQSFDVVHCHGIYPAGYLAALCKHKLGCPIVITTQGDDVRPESPRLMKPGILARHIQALEAADALISVSSFTRAGFDRICPHLRSRIVDIPNGVDVKAFSQRVPRPAKMSAEIEPQQYALFVGRLVYRKGADVLLKALPDVPRNGRVQVVIVGDGADRPALESLAITLGISDRVRFLGTVVGSEKIYLIQNALCLVVPSRIWEGLPLVALEGLAAGKPLIGSNLPGLADVIIPDQTGFLVPAECPAALANTLTRVFQRSSPLTLTEEHAVALAHRYSWQAIAASHISLYETVRSRFGLPGSESRPFTVPLRQNVPL